jgi:hypothetical protein
VPYLSTQRRTTPYSGYSPAGAGWGRPQLRRRWPRLLAAVGILTAVAVGGLWLAGPQRQGNHGTANTPAPASYLEPAPGTTQVGVCLDATTGFSFSGEFPPASRTQLADAVAGLAPPEGAPPTHAEGTTEVATPQAGLHLVVRPVDTRANSTAPSVARFSTELTLPTVSGLRAGPNLRDYPTTATGADRFAADQRTFTTARNRVTQERAAARTAASAGAGALRTLPLDDADTTLSDQLGCLSALVELVGSQPASYIVFSDLQPTVPPQLGSARVRDGQLVIVQPCDGDVARCTQWRQAFEDGAHQLGFTRITSVRPEVAAGAVINLLTKGRS